MRASSRKLPRSQLNSQARSDGRTYGGCVPLVRAGSPAPEWSGCRLPPGGQLPAPGEGALRSKPGITVVRSSLLHTEHGVMRPFDRRIQFSVVPKPARIPPARVPQLCGKNNGCSKACSHQDSHAGSIRPLNLQDI